MEKMFGFIKLTLLLKKFELRRPSWSNRCATAKLELQPYQVRATAKPSWSSANTKLELRQLRGHTKSDLRVYTKLKLMGYLYQVEANGLYQVEAKGYTKLKLKGYTKLKLMGSTKLKQRAIPS